MVTREELKSDASKVEGSISKLETILRQDMAKLENKISKTSEKFDKVQLLIFATLLTVVFKDYLISLF